MLELSSGEATGNSVDDGSPISIGMLTPGVSFAGAVSSGSASVRSLGKPATLAASGGSSERTGEIRQIAQAAQLGRALESGENKKLSYFRVAIAVDQRTPGRRDSSGHGGTRSVRRTKRQDQNHNGEKYAAYWKYAENRQHQL